MRAWPWRALAALLVLCGIAVPALAGDLRDYTHDVWTTRDGLPHNTISDMAQSSEGYLWLATWEGLVRYNGNEFRVYDRRSQPALRDSAIAAVYASRRGGLWFADSRGNLGCWQSGDRLRYWGRAQGLPGTVIDSVFEDAQGMVWITLNGTGLGRLHPASGRFELLRPPSDGAGFVGIRPVQDDAGRLWIGTLHGLMYVDGDRLLPAPAAFGLKPVLSWPYRAADGRIWVVAGDTLYRMQDGGLQHWRTLPQAGRITALLQDDYGTLWLGTENRGVLRLDEDGVEQVGRAMGLPDGRVAVLFEDHEGSLWAGVNGGLYRLREALFSTIGVQAGLVNDFVRTLAQDAGGTVWIGGSSGLDGVAADGGIRHVELPPANANRGEVSVLALLAAGDEVWAGTYGDGIYHLREGRVLARFDRDDGLPNNHVRSLAPARGGGLWVGTRQGVARLRDGRVEPLQGAGVPHTLVHALPETPRELWIAALSGLYRYADGVAEKVPLGEDDDGGQRVLALYHDAARDALWVSSDRGLYRLRGGKVAHVGLAQGLPVDAVFQMVVDPAGSAWLGSNRGVLRMDYAQLDAVADGRLARVGVDLYGNRDGMANAQGNGGSGISTLLAADGAVWFATAGGAAVVQPARLQRFRELPAPAVVVEALLADGRPLPFVEQGQVRVPAGTRRLAITYAALTYLSPQGVRYRSRLDGFDRGWVPRGSHRTVEFTSLPPGDYRFRVEAANGEGAPAGAAAVLGLRIEPYWWQRTSVRIAGALALAMLAFGLYRRRLVQYRRDTARLARLVDERTGDLKRQAEQLAEADREKQGLLDRLGAQARLLEQQAHQDALTGLPNRRAFEARARWEIERAQRERRPLSLAILDIDHFKRINDERSHAIGDEVLRRFAAVVGQACRADDFLARIGGEEFVLLLPGLPLDAARAACERLRAAVAGPVLAQVAQGLPVTVSIGVTEAGAGATPGVLMQEADAALYRAKHGGRNRVESAGADR